jgi:hypothetical protein
MTTDPADSPVTTPEATVARVESLVVQVTVEAAEPLVVSVMELPTLTEQGPSIAKPVVVDPLFVVLEPLEPDGLNVKDDQDAQVVSLNVPWGTQVSPPETASSNTWTVDPAVKVALVTVYDHVPPLSERAACDATNPVPFPSETYA